MSVGATAAKASGNLLPRDVEMFDRLGIPEALLEKAGVRRVSDREARELLGPCSAGDMTGILFPYFQPATMNNGARRWYLRIRRDNPELENGKPKRKYASPFADKKHFFFPPVYESFADVEVPIILVESEKASLALTAWSLRVCRKILPLAMGGCYGWTGRIGIKETPNGDRIPEMGPIPDLGICRDRRVTYVLLDANCKTNPKVQTARRSLVRALRKQGADVRVIDLPAQEGVNGPDDFLAACGDQAMQELLDGPTASVKEAFRSIGELDQGEVVMLIDQILSQGVTIVGGLSGSAKTWWCISVAKALTTGQRFLNKWSVNKPTPVLYLVPESGDRAFGSRCRKMRIPDDREKFLCRTANDITLDLDSPETMEIVSRLKCVVILDTFVRFNSALDENSATQNQVIVKKVQGLLAAGAPAVVLIHHSPKSQSQITADEMTLENVLRGSGDIGAAADVVYGLKTINRETNEAQVVCVKARDIEAVKPFNIVGRPYIDEIGDFLLSVQPGEQREMPTASKALLLQKCERILAVDPEISLGALAKAVGESFTPKATKDSVRWALDYGFWTYSRNEKRWTKGRCS